MKENTFVHRLRRRTLSLCLAVVLAVSLCVPALAVQKNYSASDYVQRLKDSVRGSATVDLDAGKDPNEVVRAMVVTNVPAAVEQAGTVTYTAAVQSAEARPLRSQESVIRQVRRITGSSVINQSGYLVSAFSMDMTRAQMKQVAALDGVVSVSEVTSYQARMTSAKEMTSAMELWKAENGGSTGEGIVVAVIDSGVNYSHPDMQMRQDARLKYTKADMEAKIAALGYGKYYTDKVPFGFSYVDEDDINNRQVTHGLHVSGIVAANGDEENGGVAGVAPDAQLFAMQVFGSTGSGFNDDIIRAVEDSVKLGADILNLSLGGTAGFYSDADYLQKALAYAEENGAVVCVAAGNDGTSASDTGVNTNDWGVIDTGAVSNPATYPGALSVASVDNSMLRGKSVTITSGEDTVYSGVVMDFSQGNHTDWTSLGEVPILEFGYGDLFEDIFPKLSTLPEGPYVALVQRGKDISFEDKINYLMGMCHASAVIVYNNEATDQVPTNVSAESASQYTAMMVSGSTGARLMELVQAGATVSFDGLHDVVYPNEATGGKVSTFSSWGSTPTLDIKPEISAPGGNILSVSKGEKYEEMSGTSMATPNASGAFAVVLEKPPQLAVHPTLNYPGGTLANGYAAWAAEHGHSPVFRPVNRIDKDTSGLVLAAKNAYAAPLLAGGVAKLYYAIAQGALPLGEGVIDAPIGRRGDSIIGRCVTPEGKPSRTEYTIIKEENGLSLAACVPVTGRTHQIRVHFASIGHPLAGDDLYGGSRERIARQALHCARQSFAVPVYTPLPDGIRVEMPLQLRTVTVESPLPPDMEALFS